MTRLTHTVGGPATKTRTFAITVNFVPLVPEVLLVLSYEPRTRAPCKRLVHNG